MEIKRIGAYPAQGAQRAPEQASRVMEEKAANGRESSREADRLKLSGPYREMVQVKKVMMDRSETRMEKIDHFRTMVQQQSYVVEPEKVAAKMIEDMW